MTESRHLMCTMEVPSIQNSGGSVDAMVKAIDASFLYSISTDSHPLHMKCPEHKHKPPDHNSWCKYRVAEFEGTPKPLHKPLIPRDLRVAEFEGTPKPLHKPLIPRDLRVAEFESTPKPLHKPLIPRDLRVAEFEGHQSLHTNH